MKLALLPVCFAFAGCSSDAPTEAPTGLQGSPQVTTASWTTAPARAADLRVSCSTIDGASSQTCPVITWSGITYWAYSYADNRTGMAIVAYDASGKALGTLERSGARYLSQITVDQTAQTATLRGQANATITVTWAELRTLAAAK